MTALIELLSRLALLVINAIKKAELNNAIKKEFERQERIDGAEDNPVGAFNQMFNGNSKEKTKDKGND